MAASHFRSLEITRDGSKGDNSRPYLTMQDVPPETASAEEVQCFIEQLLLSQYKVDAERAHQLSQCWSIGTGRELRKYPARLFVKIFGDEAGWVLYKEIHSRLFQSQMEETGVGVLDPKTRRKAILAACLSEGILLALVLVIDSGRLLTVPLLVFGAVVLLTLAVMDKNPSTAANAEADLRALYR